MKHAARALFRATLMVVLGRWNSDPEWVCGRHHHDFWGNGHLPSGLPVPELRDRGRSDPSSEQFFQLWHSDDQ